MNKGKTTCEYCKGEGQVYIPAHQAFTLDEGTVIVDDLPIPCECTLSEQELLEQETD